MSKSDPFKYGRRVCIFCGGENDTKISDEHVWPKWAADLFPPRSDHGVFAGKLDKGDRTFERHKDLKRQGSLSTFKVRQVCRACNSGWMQGYEESVRPFLEPLILGQRRLLNADEKQCLLEYLTYKILVIDAGFEDRFISEEAASDFYHHRTLPGGMTVDLLHCHEGDWQLGIRCIGAAFSHGHLDPKMPPNVKSFAVGFGHLFVFAVCRKEVEFDFDLEAGAAIRLLPVAHPTMLWPTLRPINSAQADFVAMTVWRTGNAPNIIDGEIIWER